MTLEQKMQHIFFNNKSRFNFVVAYSFVTTKQYKCKDEFDYTVTNISKYKRVTSKRKLKVIRESVRYRFV